MINNSFSLKKRFSSVLVFVFFSGCSSFDKIQMSDDLDVEFFDADTDTDITTDTSNDIDADTDTDTDTDIDDQNDTDTDTDIDDQNDSDTDTDIDDQNDSDTDTDTNTDTGNNVDPNCPTPLCTSVLYPNQDFCHGDIISETCDPNGNDIIWECDSTGQFVVQSTVYGCTVTSEPGAGTRVCPNEVFTRSCWPITDGQARVDWECQGSSSSSNTTFSQVNEDYCTASSGPEAGTHFCPGEVILRDNCGAGGTRDHFICPDTATTGSAFVLDISTSCSIEVDEWETLHRGLRLKRWTLNNHRFRALEFDLCDTSLRVVATASADRGQTTSSWGAAQGMLAAINGGFFVPGTADPDGCLAFGGGTEWPDSADTTARSFIAFGPQNIGYSSAGYLDVPPYPGFSWMEEAVCGDATLVAGGNTIPDSNPSVRSRTGAGYSSDGRTLYLLTVDENGSNGMTVNNFAPILQGLGADFGINLDGGGSTTMWTESLGRVNVPSGSERTVANHLGIWLEGGTQGYNCPN